jgi:hypothetical protein
LILPSGRIIGLAGRDTGIKPAKPEIPRSGDRKQHDTCAVPSGSVLLSNTLAGKGKKRISKT